LNIQELEQLVYKLVLQALKELDVNKSNGIPPTTTESSCCDGACACGSLDLIKQVISESDVRHARMNGAKEICIPQKTIVTCLAAEYATKQGVVITRKSNFSGTNNL